MSIGALIVPLLIYWVVLFAAIYVVAEYGQYYLYDEATPRLGLKAAGGSLVLALLLLWTRSSFDTMFTDEIGKTILQGIAWFAVFTLVLRFQPQHGALLGVLTMLLIPGLASLGVDSIGRASGKNPLPVRRPSQPFRQAMPQNLGPPPATKKAAPPAG